MNTTRKRALSRDGPGVSTDVKCNGPGSEQAAAAHWAARRQQSARPHRRARVGSGVRTPHPVPRRGSGVGRRGPRGSRFGLFGHDGSSELGGSKPAPAYRGHGRSSPAGRSARRRYRQEARAATGRPGPTKEIRITTGNNNGMMAE